MPRIPKLLIVALVSLALAPASHASVHRTPRHKFRQQIVELEEQWRTSALKADIPTLDRMLSDDYVGISWTGQVSTKATQIENFRSRSFVITRLDLSELKLKIVGTVAIVTRRAHLEGINNGTPVNGVFLYTRVYQRLPQGIWKITNFEATRSPNVPVPPPGPEGPPPPEHGPVDN